MKSSVAFALGLWVGGLAVGMVAVVYFRPWSAPKPEPAPATARPLAAESEELRLLRQDKARLTAENQRYRQTVAELKVQRERATAPVRRVPFRRVTPPAGSSATPEAVDVGASEPAPASPPAGSEQSVESLAKLAEQDHGEAMLRAWSDGALQGINRRRAAIWLGTMLELNPKIEPLLRGLIAEGGTNPALVAAAAQGMANPPVEVAGAVHTNFEMRKQLLEAAWQAVTNAALRAEIKRSLDKLYERWAAAAPPEQ